MPKDNRVKIQPLGEMYADALAIEAFLKDRTEAAEANSLLCSTLQRRHEYREEAIAYLAKKRNVSPEKLKADIIVGRAEKLEPDDYKALLDEEVTDNDND